MLRKHIKNRGDKTRVMIPSGQLPGKCRQVANFIVLILNCQYPEHLADHWAFHVGHQAEIMFPILLMFKVML